MSKTKPFDIKSLKEYDLISLHNKLFLVMQVGEDFINTIDLKTQDFAKIKEIDQVELVTGFKTVNSKDVKLDPKHIYLAKTADKQQVLVAKDPFNTDPKLPFIVFNLEERDFYNVSEVGRRYEGTLESNGDIVQLTAVLKQ